MSFRTLLSHSFFQLFPNLFSLWGQHFWQHPFLFLHHITVLPSILLPLFLTLLISASIFPSILPAPISSSHPSSSPRLAESLPRQSASAVPAAALQEWSRYRVNAVRNDSEPVLLLPSPPLWGCLLPTALLPGNSLDSFSPKSESLCLMCCDKEPRLICNLI